MKHVKLSKPKLNIVTTLLCQLVATACGIVVPRVDDCVGIYLGSEERYLEYFNKYKGTFWAFPSWAESSPSTDANYLDIMRAEYMNLLREE